MPWIQRTCESGNEATHNRWPPTAHTYAGVELVVGKTGGKYCDAV